MIKHIVMWKIEAPEGKSKEEVLSNIKKELENLQGQIEGLSLAEVGINYNTSNTAYDAVLCSEFTNQAALENYQKHEKHQHVANTFVRPFATARAVVDYEI
ncbi:MAG: Dabb family protein [Cellulosilyticaceae bacterium]